MNRERFIQVEPRLEVGTALARECNEERSVLFPICLDDMVMKIETGGPALIKYTRHIGDFCQWIDHDSYQKVFARLLRDLKAEKEKACGRQVAGG